LQLGNHINGEATPGNEPHRFMRLALQEVPLTSVGLFVFSDGKALR
jgi:hypothetical protein